MTAWVEPSLRTDPSVGPNRARVSPYFMCVTLLQIEAAIAIGVVRPLVATSVTARITPCAIGCRRVLNKEAIGKMFRPRMTTHFFL